jgi:hypothetical protein
MLLNFNIETCYPNSVGIVRNVFEMTSRTLVTYVIARYIIYIEPPWRLGR